MMALSQCLSQKTGSVLIALGLSILVISMNGCEGLSWNESQLVSAVRAQGEIRVLTVERPLVYSPKKSQEGQGLDHDLLVHFAETYGLRLRFIVKKDTDEVYEGLRSGEGDVAAARLWIPERSDGFMAGPALEESTLSLFCRRSLKIAHIRDLSRRQVVIPVKDNFEAFDVRLRQFVDDVRLELDPKSSSRELVRRVATGRADCVILENMDGGFLTQAFPAVEKVSVLSDERPLGWVLRPEEKDLRDLMYAWFQRASRDDDIMRIQDRYRTGLSELDGNDTRHFLRDTRAMLPRYLKAFRESAEEHGLDWRLIAAVAYQESKWQSEATSHTGVRGLMQLTAETAQNVGIEDRTDPLQSIWGGSFYLRKLVDRMPMGLDPQEKLALALASYNCGLAHLRDAQTLARERGLNPYSWRHLKMVFPLLEDEDIAATLPFGAARGRETVQFVDRVRAYYSLFHLLN